jgi:hypothetical protein
LMIVLVFLVVCIFSFTLESAVPAKPCIIATTLGYEQRFTPDGSITYFFDHNTRTTNPWIDPRNRNPNSRNDWTVGWQQYETVQYISRLLYLVWELFLQAGRCEMITVLFYVDHASKDHFVYRLVLLNTSNYLLGMIPVYRVRWVLSLAMHITSDSQNVLGNSRDFRRKLLYD